MTFVFLLLAIVALITGGWETINSANFFLLILSGFVGIFLGDTFLFYTLDRVGPRRNSILFSMAAPIALFLNFFFLHHSIGMIPLIGCFGVVVGVIIAIIYGKQASQLHIWERVKKPLWLGVVTGLLAATGQAVGIIIAKPAMESGADPLAASALRVGVAAILLIIMGRFPIKFFHARDKADFKTIVMTCFSGFLGMAVGMTLLLVALKDGDAGIVTTLSSTIPIMVLPLIWLKTRQRPAGPAWLGAFVAVSGIYLIFNY
jgi:uncharacterized membrane protein